KLQILDLVAAQHLEILLEKKTHMRQVHQALLNQQIMQMKAEHILQMKMIFLALSETEKRDVLEELDVNNRSTSSSSKFFIIINIYLDNIKYKDVIRSKDLMTFLN